MGGGGEEEEEGTKTTKNALQLLMQGKGRRLSTSTKKRRGRCGSSSLSSSAVKPKKKSTPFGGSSRRSSTSIGFVICPAGCGCHIPNLEHKINQHLDVQCSVLNNNNHNNNKKKTQLQPSQPQEKVVVEEAHTKKRRKLGQEEEQQQQQQQQHNEEQPKTKNAGNHQEEDQKAVEETEEVDDDTAASGAAATPNSQAKPISTPTCNSAGTISSMDHPILLDPTSTECDDTIIDTPAQPNFCSQQSSCTNEEGNNPQTAAVTSSAIHETPAARSSDRKRQEGEETPTVMESCHSAEVTPIDQEKEVDKEVPSPADSSFDYTPPSSKDETVALITPKPPPPPPPQPTPPITKASNNNDNDNPHHGTNSKRNLTIPQQSKSSNKSTDSATTNPANNVFLHMMQNSSKVFSKKPSTQQEEMPQCFSLHYDATNDSFSCNLTTTATTTQVPSSSSLEDRTTPPSIWTGNVQVKDKQRQSVIGLALSATCSSSCTTNSNMSPPSSSLLPQQQRSSSSSWVKYPSRLSVPVLKSILQKSIRRRRPLPSVRIAMELMDKALGELVRRLPIIILEDSSLHPDFAVVVWAMIAHSKGFFDPNNTDAGTTTTTTTITPASSSSSLHAKMIEALKLRLVRIVYQVASCPVQDLLREEEVLQVREDQPCLTEPFLVKRPSKIQDDDVDTSTTKDQQQKPKQPKQQPQQQQQQQEKKDLQVSIWSMLVRAQYGGMACDVKMCQGFAQLWHDRLWDNDSDEVGINSNLPTAANMPPPKNWSHVPMYLHTAGTKQSLIRIPCATMALEHLSLTDICKEGVDFHCSNIVDTLLADANIAGESGELAKELNITSTSLLLKRCIWKFSAGVNLRRPLMANKGIISLSQASTAHEEEPLKSFWKDVLLPHITAFQTKYVAGRIFKKL